MKHQKYLLFDFDGPILDVKRKYHRVYSDILRSFSFSPLDETDYWTCKRNKVPDFDILRRSQAESILEKYWSLREGVIETKGYLDLDELQNEVQDVLGTLHERYKLVLVTMRTSPEGVNYQLREHGLTGFFSNVLCSGSNQKLHNAHRSKWEIKYAMVSKYLLRENQTVNSIVAMVGDTETDIRCAQALGCKSFACESGIRTSELLAKESPDFVLKELRPLLNSL